MHGRRSNYSGNGKVTNVPTISKRSAPGRRTKNRARARARCRANDYAMIEANVQMSNIPLRVNAENLMSSSRDYAATLEIVNRLLSRILSRTKIRIAAFFCRNRR